MSVINTSNASWKSTTPAAERKTDIQGETAAHVTHPYTTWTSVASSECIGKTYFYTGTAETGTAKADRG